MRNSSHDHQPAVSGQQPTAESRATVAVAAAVTAVGTAATVSQEEHQQADVQSHDTASTSDTSALAVVAYEPEVGYKYGYHPQPAFERVSQWERSRPFDERISKVEAVRRAKNETELEITRQLPLWQPVELGSAWLETSSSVREGPLPSAADYAPTSHVNPQSESMFVSLLSEDIRYAIYEVCLAVDGGNPRWYFSPLKYKARYEDEHGIARPQERSRTTLLLCCRQLYLEVRPCLLRLLKNAVMANLAPRFLPWSMPSSNLTSIRSLSWHFFFECGPGMCVPSDLTGNEHQGVGQPRTCTSSFEYAAAWDIVLAHMPSLQELRFHGYIHSARSPSATTAIFAIHEAKLLEPLRRAQEARRNGGPYVGQYRIDKLDRILVELHWPSRHDEHAVWQAMLKGQWKSFVAMLYRSAKNRREEREMLRNATESRGTPRRSRRVRASDAPEAREGARNAEVAYDEDAHILMSQPEARRLTDILVAPGCKVVVKHLYASRLAIIQERSCGLAMRWYLDPVYVKNLEAGAREFKLFNGEETFVTNWNVEGV